jgi:hypothetical protein
MMMMAMIIIMGHECIWRTIGSIKWDSGKDIEGQRVPFNMEACCM